MQKSVITKDFNKDFEEAHIFEKYFPSENIDACVKKCQKNKLKTMILKKVKTGTYKPKALISSEMAIIEEFKS